MTMRTAMTAAMTVTMTNVIAATGITTTDREETLRDVGELFPHTPVFHTAFIKNGSLCVLCGESWSRA